MAAHRRGQRGAALLTAMLVVAIATILAASIVWLDRLQQRRVANILGMDQAMLYAYGAESWSFDILAQDAADSQVDHLAEEWAIPLPPLPVDGGQIEGRMEDLQARFNVNNLVTVDGEPDERWVEAFRRLLQALEIDPAVATRVVDWIDLNPEVSFPDGAEDDAYTGKQPPYRPGNGPVTSITELLAVDGMTAEAFDVLAPHLAALPRDTLVNVNTATPVVLASLSEGMSVFEAESIAEGRIDAPFESLDDVGDEVGPEARALLSVNTEYFRAIARVTLGTTRLTMYSLVERDATLGTVRVRLRTFGSE